MNCVLAGQSLCVTVHLSTWIHISQWGNQGQVKKKVISVLKTLGARRKQIKMIRFAIVKLIFARA